MRTMAKSAASTGPSDCAPRTFARPCSIVRAGRRHPERVDETTEHENDDEGGNITPARQPSDARPAAGIDELEPGHACRERDVVVRAGVHTVQAEGAIEVADLRREKQRQLATTAQDSRRNGFIPSPLDAINRSTRPACLRLPHLQFERRHRRRDEAELADRTEILAEGRAGEQQIDRPGPRRSSRGRATLLREAIAHRSNSSYVKSTPMKSAMPIHFTRSHRGHFSDGARSRRP